MSGPQDRLAHVLTVALAVAGIIVILTTAVSTVAILGGAAAEGELATWQREAPGRAIEAGGAGGEIAARVALAAPIAIPIVAYAALVPLFIRLRRRSYALMAGLQILVLLSAAAPAIVSIVRLLGGV